jgi:hypothetical protein
MEVVEPARREREEGLSLAGQELHNEQQLDPHLPTQESFYGPRSVLVAARLFLPMETITAPYLSFEDLQFFNIRLQSLPLDAAFSTPAQAFVEPIRPALVKQWIDEIKPYHSTRSDAVVDFRPLGPRDLDNEVRLLDGCIRTYVCHSQESHGFPIIPRFTNWKYHE